jgi:cation:H+ antiporter
VGALALGNAIGSNIANLGLILGITTLIKPARVDGALPKREVPVMVATALALPAVMLDGALSRGEAGLLVLAAVAYTIWMVRSSRTVAELVAADEAADVSRDAATTAGAPVSGSKARMLVTALVGLGVLILGGRLFVSAAQALALALGVSERVVGLTVVAIGTSLPELATSLIAAKRGHADIAVGNVIGSNIFNILLCVGGAGLIGSIRAPLATLRFDLGWLMGMTVLGALFFRSQRDVTRSEGFVLLTLYALFTVLIASP